MSETPWPKPMWVQKVSMGSRGGWDKHWGLLHRNPTSGPRNPKLEVAGSYEVMKISMICTCPAFSTCCERQGWDTDP